MQKEPPKKEMVSLNLTKELFEFLFNSCHEFFNKTQYDVTVEDVLFSFFRSDENHFHVYNDWDEGEGNDPFWNKEDNEHSAISFLKLMCEEIKNKTV